MLIAKLFDWVLQSYFQDFNFWPNFTQWLDHMGFKFHSWTDTHQICTEGILLQVLTDFNSNLQSIPKKVLTHKISFIPIIKTNMIADQLRSLSWVGLMNRGDGTYPKFGG